MVPEIKKRISMGDPDSVRSAGNPSVKGMHWMIAPPNRVPLIIQKLLIRFWYETQRSLFGGVTESNMNAELLKQNPAQSTPDIARIKRTYQKLDEMSQRNSQSE
jgi:hypothetical protein